MTAQQLKNSILQMAVQGKLVPQDPNDEPASILLQRIKAEKQELIKTGKIKKDKKSSEIFRGATHNLPYAYCEQIGKEIRDISDEIPFEIPESWEWVRLGIISTYNQAKQKINAKDADVSIWGLDLEDLEKGGRLLVKKTVGERKAVGDKTIFTKGDVLYSKLRPYLLKILVAPDSGICTPEIVPFTVYGGISAEYIVNFLKSPYVDGLVNGETYGIKMPRAGTDTMISLLVPLPPLSEQHRIVAKIEELLPYIERYGKAEEHLTTLNTTFPEALKKSILQEAVQGKLVPQNPDDEPASVLLERIRAEKQALIKAGKIKKDKHESVIVTRDKIPYEIIDGKERCIADEVPFEIPDSWCWCRLGTIFQHNTGKTLNSSNHQGTMMQYITTSNLYWDRFELDKLREMLFTDSEVEKCTVTKGDLLVCEGGDIGRAAIWNYDYPMRIQNHIHRLRSYAPVEVYFFYYVFYLYKRAGLIGGKGIGIQGLSSNAIDKLLIPLPPLAEQKKVVAKIEELMQYCDKL
ncbi:EcoKI restriction-modification system protein HsdS [uncultured Ruminococcus sp.]|uniref:restriction endonuclease subunit S n=1 Tax=uncultured Ruminococcus sp. TaxID=165186 RepID=UPI000822570F|nr:restriction endonuclease subunit S [uncultured Ruminococcus sp.]SCJ49841.1 EcoKI restriction-modification system protein HsdS [uncultured Ruminococcus sp.]